MGGWRAPGAERGGHEDAHRLLAGGDDAVGAGRVELAGGGNLGQGVVEGGVELIEDGDGGGSLAVVRDLRRDAEVPVANGGERRPGGRVAGAAARAASSSRLVTPQAAETTATRGAGWASTMAAASRTRRASPTEVPPNFMTITAGLLPSCQPTAISRQRSAFDSRTGSTVFPSLRERRCSVPQRRYVVSCLAHLDGRRLIADG